MSNQKMTNFKILKSINKGAFAHVYEVLETVSGRNLALKIVSKKFSY